MDFEKARNEFEDEEIWFDGGLGSSFDDAVIIRGTKNTVVGVKAEKRFIDQRIYDWHFVKQELFTRNKKKYDVLTIGLSDGSFERIYFDITDFFGKF